MWRAPNRPNHEITESYNDGIVNIYTVQDGAAPGYRPMPVLVLVKRMRYQERYLGINRLYSGRQNQVDIQRIVRVQKVPGVSNQNVAITEDGRQYRIDSVQDVIGAYPPSIDLTLATVEQEYEVRS